MSSRRYTGWRALAAAAVALSAGTALWAGAVMQGRVQAGSTVPGAPRIELASDPGIVVIHLREEIGEMRSPDQPWMKVYADGRVERHLPHYMKNAGDWVGSISPERLERLAVHMAGAGLVEFDSQAVRGAKEAAERGSGVLYNASDTSVITIEVRFDGYQPAGSLAMSHDVRKSVSWDGLRSDTRRFTQIAPIQELGAAFSRLSALADHIVATGEIAALREEVR